MLFQKSPMSEELRAAQRARSIREIKEVEDSQRETFFFIIFTTTAKETVQVMDLSHTCSYQRDDWNCVNSENYDNRDAAIACARALANEHNLKYDLFESRYGDEPETLQLTVTVAT